MGVVYKISTYQLLNSAGRKQLIKTLTTCNSISKVIQDVEWMIGAWVSDIRRISNE